MKVAWHAYGFGPFMFHLQSIDSKNFKLINFGYFWSHFTTTKKELLKTTSFFLEIKNSAFLLSLIK